ncbi:MAG: hypothetical protein ACFE8V_05410 [Promethearchaeota archaeon]
MDIAEFNKELKYRVAKATGLENNNKIEEAIDEWVAITEMVIKTSKTPNLEFSYRSMLIDKTKQIIEHIKSLKIKLSGEITAIEDISEYKEEDDIQSVKAEDTIESKEFNEEVTEVDSQEPIETKIIDKSEFKNLPKGFKEIEASKDFEIITPHDKDYIKKILSEDKPDMNVFKFKKGENQNRMDQNKTICFACGIELAFDTKICPQCGTKLK